MVSGVTGSDNPCYGKVLITNGTENRFIDPSSENYQDMISKGFWRGRSVRSRKEG